MAASAQVKQEPGTSALSNEDLSERSVNLPHPTPHVQEAKLYHTRLNNMINVMCDEASKGVVLSSLQQELTGFTPQQITTVINQLLKAKKLKMVQKANVHYIMKVTPTEVSVAAAASTKVTGLTDHDEKLVYQIVESAGNKGIWEKDVRNKSKLPLVATTKILKNLESKKIIKSVNSVSANRKKMYMLYELVPDVSVTGGTWYSDQTFDTEFVQLITEYCYVCLQKKAAAADKMQREMKLEPMAHRNSSFATSAEILNFITELRVKLSLSDIEMIMESLVYDSKVERSVVIGGGSGGGDSGQMKSYRAVAPLVPNTGLMRMPCGLCPVIDECHEGGVISPATCQYMQTWLNEKLQF